MPRRLNLPDSASVAEPGADGRLHAPSAERNVAPLTDLLRLHAPSRGGALELASGTGQHVAAFSAALPGLTWQPTEIEPDRRASIDAWAAKAARPNLLAARELDATAPGWHAEHAGRALIVVVNLLHLIGTREARTLIDEAARALAPAGRFIIYGPFLRDGLAVSEGDQRFDASLRAQDPEIGYKDAAEVKGWLTEAGLAMADTVEMPANNLSLVAERP